MANEERKAQEFVQKLADQQKSEQAPAEENQTKVRRGFIELLVDPRTLHGLMLCGGGLLVLGLVTWLWSIGVFENPLVVAGCLGAGTAALLGAGIAAVRFSRYQTAGKSVTLLACLVMPLNLWFYDAQGLTTLAHGGHLWVPALVCCAIYIAVARLLADPMFVHAIVGGITMTGMLFLADRQVGHFWEIIPPSAFLVVLGMLCIHVERAFSPGGGTFSRERFGREFFRAGHVVMGLGLTVLFVGRLCGRLYDPFLAELGWFDVPAVASQANLKLFALALALGGAYSYVYSQVVVRANGRYLASAAFALLWSGIILLDLLAIPFTMELLVLLTSLAALASNATAFFHKHPASAEETDNEVSWTGSLSDTAKSLGMGLNLASVGLGVALYAAARFDFLPHLLTFEFGSAYLVAMILAGISCWLGLRVAEKSSSPTAGKLHLQGLAVATLLAVVATLACLGMTFSIATLSLEMVLPLVFAGVSIASRTKPRQQAFSRAAELTATMVLIVGVCIALGLVTTGTVGQPHLWLTVLFAEAALCFGLASVHATRLTPSGLAAISICGATWQLLLYLGVTQYVSILAASIVGLLALAAAELPTQLRERFPKHRTVCLWTGRLGVSYGGVAAMLLSLTRLLVSETHWAILYLLLAQAVASVIAGFLSRQSEWRRSFFVLAAGEVLLSLLVVISLSELSFLQRVELLLTASGLLTLAAGYLGWFREENRPDSLVSFNLAVGSMLSAIPLTIGLVVQRFGDSTADWGWAILHEAGVLAIGMTLLGAGVLCRIRWSTLAGGGTVLVYVLSLVGLMQLPDQLQSTAVYMMVGGGMFFTGAVLLSVYRDRLLGLRRRMQEGEGVFQILKWR